ncbi:hypothetical protein GVN16_20070 [Emticicia sp. CRIBPO]|uniref:hypothetical protein n=1 Tax=Emticicia sp. CRIBPO TaxID=2683258 RepID=UPI00141340B8|nr:hypothetical protein [Emticicia sp. CRIBPO]NBA88079.1 hypothetical protein [Emticicia sp. CRIBPO]
MEAQINQKSSEDSGSQHISIKDCLRLIGIKELTANIYAVPSKRKEKEVKLEGAY